MIYTRPFTFDVKKTFSMSPQALTTNVEKEFEKKQSPRDLKESLLEVIYSVTSAVLSVDEKKSIYDEVTRRLFGNKIFSVYKCLKAGSVDPNSSLFVVPQELIYLITSMNKALFYPKLEIVPHLSYLQKKINDAKNNKLNPSEQKRFL